MSDLQLQYYSLLAGLVWTGGDIIDFGRYLHISINTGPGLLLCDSSHVCAYYSAGPAVPSSYLCYDIPSDCLSRPDLCFDPQSRPPQPSYCSPVSPELVRKPPGSSFLENIYLEPRENSDDSAVLSR